MQEKTIANIGKSVDKINTNYAKLITRKIDGRPYYEIRYFDPKDNQYHVGYGSYTKEYVGMVGYIL